MVVILPAFRVQLGRINTCSHYYCCLSVIATVVIVIVKRTLGVCCVNFFRRITTRHDTSI